jgi:hypothetical protein
MRSSHQMHTERIPGGGWHRISIIIINNNNNNNNSNISIQFLPTAKSLCQANTNKYIH